MIYKCDVRTGKATSIDEVAPSFPVDVPKPVLSRVQLMIVLHQEGLLPNVRTLMVNEPMEVQIAWDTAHTFKRTSPAVAAIAKKLGLTDRRLDELWARAATIEL